MHVMLIKSFIDYKTQLILKLILILKICLKTSLRMKTIMGWG